MADDKTTRAAIDRMAKRIREGSAKTGRNMTQESARKQAVKIAERHRQKYGE